MLTTGKNGVCIPAERILPRLDKRQDDDDDDDDDDESIFILYATQSRTS